jgi:hypothetical protein
VSKAVESQHNGSPYYASSFWLFYTVASIAGREFLPIGDLIIARELHARVFELSADCGSKDSILENERKGKNCINDFLRRSNSSIEN